MIMSLLHYKQRLSIDMQFFITSGFIRFFAASVLLLILWIAIIWSSLLP